MNNDNKQLLSAIFDDCVREGNKYKDAKEYGKAARSYDEAKRIADILRIDGEYLNAMITSCCRKAGNPQMAIRYFDYLKNIYDPSFLFNHALLTSVAGAYCDIGEWELAEQTLYKAIDANKGEKNISMEFLEDRINTHYKEEFSK